MLKNLISKSVSLALISAGITPVANADYKVNDVSVNNPKGTTIENSQITDQYNGAVMLDNGGTFDSINHGTLSGTTSSKFSVSAYIKSNTTVTNLTNTGIISGSTDSNVGVGIVVSSSTLTNLTNTGTITGTATNLVAYGLMASNSSTITNLTNTGTISAVSGGGGGNYAIIITTNSSITNLTNSGTISGHADNDSGEGITLSSNSTITNLLNTGTISGYAVNQIGRGIALGNSSTITTLTNAGTISSYSGTGRFQDDIFLSANSHLVTFNNLQSALVYSGRLPRNYSTIIQGDSYGQLQHNDVSLSESSTGDTVYTPFAGNTSVPVHIKSKTYSNVMTGIPDANLNDTISGTLSGDGENSIGSVNWQLSNTSSNNWDLITSGGTYTYVGKANTQTAITNTASSVSNSFNGMSAGGNFANMTTYDCNYFGSEDGCLSIGGRVTEANGTDTKAVLVVGKKVSDTFRYGGFVDQTIAHHGYNDIDINPKVPLVGMMGVWNKSPDKKGLQVKLANSYQKNESTITRSAVGSSELAKGTTDIETQSYIIEASYEIENSSDKEVRPFSALRYMKTKQEGYREKNVNAPMVYSKAVEESTDILAGIKANYKINDIFTFNYALGLEHSLNDNNAQLVGDIAGISDFKPVTVGGDKEKTRKFASVGFIKLLSSKARIEGKIMRQELRYKNSKDATTIYVTYSLPF